MLTVSFMTYLEVYTHDNDLLRPFDSLADYGDDPDDTLIVMVSSGIIA
jgi:hypothetical protein